jgi:hypothetical protein
MKIESINIFIVAHSISRGVINILIENALVTINGIMFKGFSYSCSHAIKYKWYEKANISGSWECDIKYQPLDLSKIWILFENKNILIEANIIIIIYSISLQKKSAYFKKMIELKNQRNILLNKNK